GEGAAQRHRGPQPHALRLAAHRPRLRRPHPPLHRGEERHRRGGARGHHVEGERRPALLLPSARPHRGGRHVDDRQRLLPGGVRRAAHGVRRRGARAHATQPRRGGRLMLHIERLTVTVEGKRILDGLDLEIAAGEVHAVMGPNGAGKSTLSNVLAGRDGYEVAGAVTFDGEDLLALTPEERAARGLFLAFQYPVEIPGVGNMYFLHTAVNALRRQRGQAEVSAGAFLAL